MTTYLSDDDRSSIEDFDDDNDDLDLEFDEEITTKMLMNPLFFTNNKYPFHAFFGPKNKVIIKNFLFLIKKFT